MIEIDVSSPEPVYEQIISQLGLAIKEGYIGEGDKLPSIRQLAGDLDINPNTVAKAYQVLEESKVIQSNGRSGSVVQKNSVAYFENWLTQKTKNDLSLVWVKLQTLSPSKELAKKVWKQSLKELRNGK